MRSVGGAAAAAWAADADSRAAWHNPWNWYDVSGGGDVTPLDALILVNRINAHPDEPLLPPVADPPPYYDVDGDGRCTPADVILVVNNINEGLFGPAIRIARVPEYGVDGVVGGSVVGGDARAYRAAPLIYIDGSGWWSKPTAESPTVELAADGSFTASVASGGIDNRAVIFCTALVPAASAVPVALGSGRIPSDLNPVAMDCLQRYGRTVEFAGYTWGVKESPEPVGPGGNRFSQDPADVYVDQQGLHLSVHFRDGHWRATEVVLLDSLGYGTYAFQTNSRLDLLPANVTFGGFTWDPYGDDVSGASPHRELDFEDGRWGQAGDPLNAQMVVQPHDRPGNRERYTIPDLAADAVLTRFFDWRPERVTFVAATGSHSPYDDFASDLIHRYDYPHRPELGHFVPTAGRESFHFNLWPIDASAPAGGTSVEVLVTDFRFWEN